MVGKWRYTHTRPILGGGNSNILFLLLRSLGFHDPNLTTAHIFADGLKVETTHQPEDIGKDKMSK